MGISLLGILLDRGINSYYPPWLRSGRKKVADYFGIFETIDFGLRSLEIFFFFFGRYFKTAWVEFLKRYPITEDVLFV